MRIDDVNRFKGSVKSAIQNWANAQIEEVVPNKAALRFVAKNYVNNVLNRMDSKLNVWIENIYLAVADEKGVIDTDSAIDMAIGIFKEVKPFEYHLGGGFLIEVGRGEVALNLPRNAIMDALVGDFGRLRFTSEDIMEFKNYLN